MINFRAKRKLFYFSLIRIVTMVILSLPTVIYGLIIFIQALLKKSTNIIAQQQILIYISLPLLVATIFFLIFSAFYNKKLRNDLIYEFYEIVTLTKLPKNLPKVVYVYTCHNDLMPARILQNSMQTYCNFEVWISEGSEKQDVIESSRKFAKKHGFNFYSVGGNGSSNKAENLNAFLKNACPSYDYLLITDSDEALDKTFVEKAIKCFYWPNFKHLGYVSPLNYVYKTDNLFSNICGNQNPFVMFYKKDFSTNYLYSQYPNLFGASCLISKKLMDKNNGEFPGGCLEDVYLESVAVRNGFSSVIIPICPCGQSFDKNISAFYRRTMRIEDWTIKLVKESKLKQYNEKYSVWFTGKLISCLTPLLLLITLGSISIIIWLLCSYTENVFSNLTFVYFLASSTLILLVTLICNLVDNTPFSTLNKLGWFGLLVSPLFAVATSSQRLKHWFNSTIRSKYSAFGGSNQKNINIKNKIILFSIIWLFIISLLIIGIVLLFVYIVKFDNKINNLGFIIPIVFLSYFWLSCFFTIFLHILGLIPNNKIYSEENFVYPSKFYEFIKIKNKFILDHQNNEDYDLSILMDRKQKNIH